MVLMAVFARGRRWRNPQRFALMAGGLSVYMVFGFLTDRELHGTADLLPHAVLAALILALAVVASGVTRPSEMQLAGTAS